MVLIPASSLQLIWGSELQLLNWGSWGPPLLGAGSLYSILSPTNSCPVSWGCRICWLHLCRGVNPPQRGYLLAVGGDPWCLRTGSWWLSSTWPENQVVKSLATHHFGPYWARRAVGEARSNQSAGHDSTPLDFLFFFYLNLNEDDGCRVNHAVERLVVLSVPGEVVILGTKTQGQKINSSITSMSILNM